MDETADFPSSRASLPPQLSQLCNRFVIAWKSTPAPRIEDYLGDTSGEERSILLRKLVQLDILHRHRRGEQPRPDEYRQRFPALDAAWLANELATLSADPNTVAAPPSARVGPHEASLADAPKLPFCCPHCRNLMPLPPAPARGVVCPGCGSSFRVESLDQSTTPADNQWLGRFQLIERVGQGGFGAVWRARDTALDRIVALKVPHASLLTSADNVQRIQREARAAAQLRHPGIVRLYEVATAEGMPVLVSDFIEGVPLKDLLEVKRLTFREAAALVAEAAEALDYAHGRGLVHRDIKPGNIMVEHARPGTVGKPVLVDFGLALREEAEIVMTVEGQIIGTPAYMSPEQAAGHGHRVDRRSDVYSLGVVLYQLLCGELPFRGSKAMLVHQVLHEDPRPPRRVNDKIPRDLETICLKAMAKEPGRRYASAGELAEDLRRFLRGEPVRARPAGRAERLWRWCRRNPTVAALTAAVAASLVAGTVTASYFAFRALAQADQARRASLLSERRRYAAEINRAQQAWKGGQIALVQDLLRAQEPHDQSPDLRGFEWYYLERQCQTDLCTLYGHEKPILCLAFSPDGRWLASASEDQTVRLWDMGSEKVSLVLKGHGQAVSSVAFSPDGQRLASAGGGYAGDGQPLAGEVKVWDRATGKELITFKGTGPFHSVAFSPDGRRLAAAGEARTTAAGSPGGQVTVWDVTTGKEVLTFTDFPTAVWSLVFSPDGRLGAAGRADGKVLLWDAGTGKEALTLQGHIAPVLGLAFSPDSRRLASASWDQTVRIWELKSGKELRTLVGHTEGVSSVAFSPDGGRLASASRDQTVKVWDTTTLSETFTLRGHTKAVLSVAFSPDGWRLASTGADRTIKVRNAATPGSALPLRGHTNAVYRVAFSPDGQQMASASEDRTVKLWDAALGSLIATLYGHTAGVWDVAFSPDGRRLASAGKDRIVKVWDSAAGEVVFTLSGHKKAVTGTEFSPDGKVLASAGEDGTVILWDLATGQALRTLSGQSGPVRSVAFSPNGALLASAGEDGTVIVWNPATGQALRTLREHSGSVRGVAFSPDGKALASAGADGTVLLWDPATGEALCVLRGHAAAIRRVSFSPDGSRLASGSDDQTVKVWDTNTGQELCTLQADAGEILSVAFSRDGRRLAAATQDGSVQVWDATTLTAGLQERREALSVLDSLFNRGLSQAEVLTRICGDPTIREPVRRQARSLVEAYGRGLLRRDADRLVQSLSNQFPLKPDLLEAIGVRPDLSPPLRREARALAEHYVENATRLSMRAQSIAGRPAKEPAEYCLALRYAEAACRDDPQEDSYVTTLGMAQYRAGQYQKSVDTLTRAGRLNAETPDAPRPADIAFLAMALYRLDKKAEAQAALQRLREVMRQPPWTKQQEAQDFLGETERVLAGQAADVPG